MQHRDACDLEAFEPAPRRGCRSWAERTIRVTSRSNGTSGLHNHDASHIAERLAGPDGLTAMGGAEPDPDGYRVRVRGPEAR